MKRNASNGGGRGMVASLVSSALDGASSVRTRGSHPPIEEEFIIFSGLAVPSEALAKDGGGRGI